MSTTPATSSPKWVTFGALALLAAIAAGGFAVCSNSGEEAAACVSPSNSLIESLSGGLTQGATGRAWQAVRSDDFEVVYFISTELQGPGLEGTGDLATFAVSGGLDASTAGLRFSVPDTLAPRYSDWGVAEGTAATSMSDDGARESQACVVDLL